MKGWRFFANKRGFSLLETLLASVLLVAVLAPLTGMFATAARAYARSWQETVLLNLGRACLEKHRALGYDELAQLAGEDSSWQPCSDFPDYEYQVAVNVYDARLAVLALVVRVRPLADRQAEVELATLVARWP
ncbi:MAG: hypothetical protein GX039_08175 [Clostridia bacterium]|nr:hypothetical protein [Clostridia bacterium]